MNIVERTVSIFLSEDGRAVLELLGVTRDSPELIVDVEDTDDMGVWVKIQRDEEEHIIQQDEEEHTLLIRWDYILAIHFPSGERRIAGLTR